MNIGHYFSFCYAIFKSQLFWRQSFFIEDDVKFNVLSQGNP